MKQIYIYLLNLIFSYEKSKKKTSFYFKAIVHISSSVLYSSYTSIIVPIIHIQVTSCNRMLHH